MSFVEVKELYLQWINKVEKHRISVKFGIYTEKILKLNSFGQMWFMLIAFYLFFYELKKAYEIFNVFIYSDDQFMNNLNSVLNNFVLEGFLVEGIENLSTRIVILFLLSLQFMIMFYFIFDFFFYSDKEIEEEFNIIHKIIFNIINLVQLLFSHSFCYINIYLIMHYHILKNSETINYIIYALNIFNSMVYLFFYIIYSYMSNDICPYDNKYFPSTSKPIFGVIIFAKFMMYHLSVLVFNFIPNFIVFLIIISMLCLKFNLLIKKIFIINYYYFLIILTKLVFFICLFFAHLLSLTKIIGNSAEIEFYKFSLSLFVSIAILPFIKRYRIKNFYFLLDYNNRLIDYTYDEIFIYNLLSKDELNFADLHKHKYICDQVIFEEKCPCLNYLENDTEINKHVLTEIKAKTCLYLSKIKGKSGLFDILYLSLLFMDNKINHGLFTFLLKFDISSIELYQFHLVMRFIKTFIELYKEFYKTPLNQIAKNRLSFKDLFNIVEYEYTYRVFLKKIKTSIHISKTFWDIIRKKPINDEKFFSYGIELADHTILISQDFGKMQKIHSNQIKLLKVFSFYLNTVLNDEEYSLILVNLVKENLQMLSKLNQVPNSNLLEKEFGSIIISGLDHNLFKIVSFNKYAKMIFKLHPTFDLKNQDIHYLQPFPFNLLHLQYLKYKFDITLLSNERPLYALQENGDIAYINANLIPCINFEGKINFFNLFYINKDENLQMSALVDINGKIFASTKDFKKEFSIINEFTIQTNIDIFENMNKFVTFENSLQFNSVDFVLKTYNNKLTKHFPCITSFIEETKQIFNKKNLGKDINNSITKDEKDKNNFSFFTNHDVSSSDINDRTSSNHSNNKKSLNKKNLIYRDKNKFKSKTINPKNHNNQDHVSVRTDNGLGSIKNDKHKNMIGLNDTNIHNESSDKFIMKNKSIFNQERNIHKEKVKISKTIIKNGYKYDLKVIKKVVINGLFRYYQISLRKYVSTPETSNISQLLGGETNLKSKIDTITTTNQEMGSVVSNSLMLNNELTKGDQDNKIRLSNYISNFQKKKFSMSSVSKICKIISFYLILVFIFILVMYIANLSFNLQENSKYTDNFNILNVILSIREKFYFMVLNTAGWVILQENLVKNSTLNLKDKVLYYNKSLAFDIDNFGHIMENFFKYDLTNYPNIKRILDSSQINMGSLLNDYNIKYTRYSMNVALQMFYSSLTEFVKIQNFSINYSDLFFTPQKFLKNAPTENEKKLTFIFYNYLMNFRNVFQNLTDYVMDDYTSSMSNNKTFFFIFIFSETAIYCLIFFIIFLMIKNLYLIHKFLINFYLKPNEKFINTYLHQINKTQKIIFNLTNDDQHINSISRNMEQKIKAYEKKISERKSKISVDNPDMSKISDFNIPPPTKTSTLSSQPLLNKEKKDIINEEKIPEKNKNVIKKQKIKFSIYINYFFKASAIILSFVYIFTIELFLLPSVESGTQDITNNVLKFSEKTVSLFLMTDSSLINIITSSTFKDINNDDLFLKYSESFFELEKHFTEYFYNNDNFYLSDVKQKLMNYNSLNFCDYFFNLSLSNNLINPDISYQDCNDSIVNKGIQLYQLRLKTKLERIYYKLKGENNRTFSFLINLANSDIFEFAYFANGYYIRNYYNDILDGLKQAFANVVNVSNLSTYYMIIIFILHFSILAYYIFFRKLKDIYMYFEKIRILLSLIQKEYAKNSYEMREFLNNFY